MDECDEVASSVMLQDLPEAMLLRIIRDLTKPSDICNLGATCRLLRAVCSSEPVWQLCCHNLETGISNLDQWRTHMDSYRALFQFLRRGRELLGLWSLLDVERLMYWDDGNEGGFAIGLWGFLSVVVCYIRADTRRGCETWRPLFELFSLSNGTTGLVYPNLGCQFILPAALILSKSDRPVYFDIVTINGANDLQKGVFNQERKGQEDTEAQVRQELASLGHKCEMPVGLLAIDGACGGLQAECLSRLRAAIRSLPARCKAVVLHSGPPQARRSRWTRWRICMQRLDNQYNGGRFAGLWMGRYGRPGEVDPRGPFGWEEGRREVLQMLYLEYGYGKGAKLKGTKLLGEENLPRLEPFFSVSCEDPDSPGKPPAGLDLAQWLWKEVDGSYPDITGWFAGEGATNGYGFRYPGHVPGVLVVTSTGDLAFLWSEKKDTWRVVEEEDNKRPVLLLLRVVDYREYLLSIERVDLFGNALLQWG